MKPRNWPIKMWAIYQDGDQRRIAFHADGYSRLTPALFATRKDAIRAINGRRELREIRVQVTVEAVSR